MSPYLRSNLFHLYLTSSFNLIALACALLAFFLIGCGSFNKTTTDMDKEAKSLRIRRVSALPKIFNPSIGEEATIHFDLTQPAQVTIKIYDSLNQLVKTLCQDEVLRGSNHGIIWNGEDELGEVVSDEAYVYVITAKSEEDMVTFDPCDRTRGIRVLAEDIKYDPEKSEITYFLPKAARVRLRVGIREGPLLGSIVDWGARSAGRQAEYWDGMDELKTLKLSEHPGMEISISAYTLPRNYLITQGNKDNRRFRDYINVGEKRRKKALPGFSHPHADHDPHLCRAPRFSLSLPKGKSTELNQIPLVSGKVPIRIEINPEDRSRLIENRFEIVIYLDNLFLYEEEGGYAPFTYLWDTKGVSPGKHIITVNLADYQGHIGTKSMLLEVEEH